jgi:hypothetical protein
MMWIECWDMEVTELVSNLFFVFWFIISLLLLAFSFFSVESRTRNLVFYFSFFVLCFIVTTHPKIIIVTNHHHLKCNLLQLDGGFAT